MPAKSCIVIDYIGRSDIVMDIIEQIKSILSHPFVGTGLAAIGIIITIMLRTPNRVRKRLCYRVSEYPHDRKWKDKIVALNVALWNEGSESIHSSNIPDNKPLHIVTKSGAIFISICDKYSSNRNSNLFSKIDHDNHTSVKINFEYLEPGDGAVIVIKYIGNPGDNILLSGFIVDGGAPVLITFVRLTTFVIYICSILLFSWLIFIVGYFSINGYIGLLLTTVGFILYPIAIGPALKRLRRLNMPKELYNKFKEVPDIT